MKLSELKTGERGVIVKVMGHGGFRKRIVEMGFIKGKVVDVLLNAPLQDPVKYKIMGYEVSLRRSEAEMIEVISVEEAAEIETNKPKVSEPLEKESDGLSDTQLRDDEEAPHNQRCTCRQPELWKDLTVQLCIRSTRACRQLFWRYC